MHANIPRNERKTETETTCSPSNLSIYGIDSFSLSNSLKVSSLGDGSFRCLFVFSFGFCCRASRERERERECPWAFSVGIFFWVLPLPPFAQYSSLLSLKGLSREAERQKEREKLNGAQRSLVALLSAWSLCDALLKLLAFWYYTCCTTVGSIKGSFPSVY